MDILTSQKIKAAFGVDFNTYIQLGTKYRNVEQRNLRNIRDERLKKVAENSPEAAYLELESKMQTFGSYAAFPGARDSGNMTNPHANLGLQSVRSGEATSAAFSDSQMMVSIRNLHLVTLGNQQGVNQFHSEDPWPYTNRSTRMFYRTNDGQEISVGLPSDLINSVVEMIRRSQGEPEMDPRIHGIVELSMSDNYKPPKELVNLYQPKLYLEQQCGMVPHPESEWDQLPLAHAFQSPKAKQGLAYMREPWYGFYKKPRESEYRIPTNEEPSVERKIRKIQPKPQQLPTSHFSSILKSSHQTEITGHTEDHSYTPTDRTNTLKLYPGITTLPPGRESSEEMGWMTDVNMRSNPGYSSPFNDPFLGTSQTTVTNEVEAVNSIHLNLRESVSRFEVNPPEFQDMTKSIPVISSSSQNSEISSEEHQGSVPPQQPLNTQWSTHQKEPTPCSTNLSSHQWSCQTALLQGSNNQYGLLISSNQLQLPTSSTSQFPQAVPATLVSINPPYAVDVTEGPNDLLPPIEANLTNLEVPADMNMLDDFPESIFNSLTDHQS
jgi:hypothetical protein